MSDTARCPHCGHVWAYPVPSTVMGHPTLTCARCKQISLASRWAPNAAPEKESPDE